MLLSSLQYFHHWLTDDKYNINVRKKFLKYIRNFHARVNPTYMFFNSFNRNRRLLTYNINEKTKKVIEYVIYDCFEKKIEKQNSDIVFSDFVNEVHAFVNDKKYRLTVFLDAIDNDFEFIYDNLKLEDKKKFDEISYFDLSRVYNIQDSTIVGGFI